MKLKTLSFLLPVLFIGLSCVAMEIDNDPEYDISEIDTTSRDPEYIRQVYYNAPEKIKTLIEIGNPSSIKRLSAIYQNADFAQALLKIYMAKLSEIIKKYPELKYRISKLTNQTDKKLIIYLREDSPARRFSTYVDPNETENINFIPEGRQAALGGEKIADISLYVKMGKKVPTFSIFKDSRFSIFIRPTENDEILVILYSEKTGTAIDKKTFPINPLNNIYDINIEFKGSELEDSTINISLPHDALFKAIKNLDLGEVKKEIIALTKQEMSILGLDEKSNTALHHAAMNDWSDPMTEQIFGYLLGVNPNLLMIANNKGETPLSMVPMEIQEKIWNLMSEKQAIGPEKEKKSSEQDGSGE